MPTAEMADFPNDSSRLVPRGGSVANKAFSGAVVWDLAVSRKSSENRANLSGFRQKHRGFRYRP
jgi:hypothetical protein